MKTTLHILLLGTTALAVPLAPVRADPTAEVPAHQPAAAECDRLAADPADPTRPADVPGVALEDLDLLPALGACIAAVEEDPTDVLSRSHLGRVLYAAGAASLAAEQLDIAAAAGHAGSQYHLAASLDWMQYEDPALIDALIEDSAAGGYAPAAQLIGADAGSSALPIDPAAFEVPQIIAALVDGDAAGVMAYRSGLPFEESGLPMGLVHYFRGFSDQLSGVFRCPTLLPVGLDTGIEHVIANRTWQPSTIGRIALELPQIFGDSLQAAEDLVEGADRGPSADDIAGPLTELLALKGEIAALKAELEKKGRKDAELFFEATQCAGPEAETLVEIADRLIRTFEEE